MLMTDLNLIKLRKNPARCHRNGNEAYLLGGNRGVSPGNELKDRRRTSSCGTATPAGAWIGKHVYL